MQSTTPPPLRRSRRRRLLATPSRPIVASLVKVACLAELEACLKRPSGHPASGVVGLVANAIGRGWQPMVAVIVTYCRLVDHCRIVAPDPALRQAAKRLRLAG